MQIPARAMATAHCACYPAVARVAVEGLGAGGVLTYTANGVTEVVAVFGGFVEVLPDRVRVLADSAERKSEINVAAAQAELKEALKQGG